MVLKKILVVAAIGAVLWAYVALDGQRFLSLDFFRELYIQQPLLTAAGYFAIYVVATAVSISTRGVRTRRLNRYDCLEMWPGSSTGSRCVLSSLVASATRYLGFFGQSFGCCERILCAARLTSETSRRP